MGSGPSYKLVFMLVPIVVSDFWRESFLLLRFLGEFVEGLSVVGIVGGHWCAMLVMDAVLGDANDTWQGLWLLDRYWLVLPGAARMGARENP